MSQRRWRTVSQYLFAIAFLAAGYAVYPWAECTLSNAQDDGQPVRQERSGDALALAEKARNRGTPKPTNDFWDRLGEAAPMCQERQPIGAASSAWGLVVLALLGAVGCRVAASRSERQLLPRDDDEGRFRGDRRNTADEEGVPEAITISQEIEIDVPGESSDSNDAVDALVNYVEHGGAGPAPSAERRAAQSAGVVDGFYCPPGLADAAVLYVDASLATASDEVVPGEERADNPDQPFETIGAAVAHAHDLFMTHRERVQVRVLPGVYQESVAVPSYVTLVNHRLPAEGNIRQHLDWLTEQQEVGHQDRVTILPPADAEVAVRFERGQKQGIYGCYLVGRDGVAQRGIAAEHCQELAIVNCVIEDFGAGGVYLYDCGGKAVQSGVQLVGSQLRNNRAPRGGAIFAKEGTLRVEQCRLEANRAQLGGALFAEDFSGPLQLTEVGFRGNEAGSEDRLTVRPDVVALGDWMHGTGQGGAAALLRCEVQLDGCKFVENTAKISGGAIAMLGARALLRADASENSFRKNTARIGAGLFMAGWVGSRCTLKGKAPKFIENRAGSDGGAICLIGLSIAQIVDAKFRDNVSSDDEGLGGAVAALKGAQFMAKRAYFRGNKTAGRGGALGAINASIVLSDGCIVEENVARGGQGGGLLCLSRSDAAMEELANRVDFKLPFVFTTRDVSIRNNRCLEQGAGIRVGNDEAAPTFPMKVTIELPMRVRNNAAKGGSEVTQDIVVRWAGRTRATKEDLEGGELLLN